MMTLQHQYHKPGDAEEICEDTMYCKSLIPIMKGLPVKKKRLARLKIDKLLYDL